jgi:hypothetical protein
MGFEPMNNGFADRPLGPLGYATLGNEEISTLYARASIFFFKARNPSFNYS